MRLQLRGKELLRLVQGRGTTLHVVRGRIWITEEGRADDCFLGQGERYRIAGDGLVLLGAEATAGEPAAEIALPALRFEVRKRAASSARAPEPGTAS
jgi:hypothetical protein